MPDNALGLRIKKDRVVVSSKDIVKAFGKYRPHNFVLTSQSLAIPKGETREHGQLTLFSDEDLG